MARKSLGYFILIGMVAFGLSGCGGGQGGQKEIADQSKISKIRQGVSTKSDIVALFGEPAGINHKEDGGEEWSYNYEDYSIKPQTYIPFVGLFAGGSTSSSSSLIVTFDKKGTVTAYATNKSGMDTSLGNK